jgi:hypothetical protein
MERVIGYEYDRSNLYACMKIEKWSPLLLLKLGEGFKRVKEWIWLKCIIFIDRNTATKSICTIAICY